MAFFNNAMDAHANKIAGENGCAELDSTSDPRVDLFFALVRDLPKERLQEMVTAVLSDSRITDEQKAHDLIVLTMQTRNCRGGKGEKGLFLEMYMEVYRRFPSTSVKLLPLVAKYGYYKDLVGIADEANKEEATAPLRAAVIEVMAARLRKDSAELAAATAEGRKPRGLSLLAKWAPREGSSGKHKKVGPSLAKEVAVKLFWESHPGRERAEYRKVVAALNRALGTVEVKMCGADWANIDPAAVPSAAMLRMRKALLNEAVKGAPPTAAERETGNRFPEDEDRVACRKRLRQCLLEEGTKKLKGKQLHPHEIVQKLMRGQRSSEMEEEIYGAQWEAIRASVKASLEKQSAEAAAGSTGSAASAATAVVRPSGGVNLGQLVPLVDVSGSMSGTPMEVAIALGILVSELTAPAFADRMLTFETSPSWVKLEAGASIAEKVQVTQRAPWGGSTNFEAALERILDVCVSAKLTPDQIPDMLVLSDMQFDQANHNRGGAWETQYERIVRRFAESGVKVCGEPWPAPQITFWNLRGTTQGFPAGADVPGVKLLSGFSPALLKLLLDGDEMGEDGPEEEVEMEVLGKKVVVKKKRKATPLETLRKCLDDAQYDAVREVLAASQEGALAAYTFTPPAVETEEKAEAEAQEEDWEEVEAP